ncbi:histidinol-phosphate transaminase [Sulfuriferula thiophila]|uniref:histidinol-phosphate transaminase n=1 Tax=Sulfuriferula thiophila TaxID=1781211 RepID=UPI000F60A22D|nr:histidinol-phosphate transaminase [Sulfuriferula thiophila]
MSRFWSPVTHTLTPYVPGEQPKLANLVKLNTNESPYGPSPKVIEALHGQATEGLRLYPDPNSDALRQAIADYHGVQRDNVFVGNGSDEVLAHAFQALLKHDLPILFPDISYSFYPVYCGLYDIRFTQVPLTESFQINVDDYMRPNGGIIFPNPNAPTGCPVTRNDIERLLQANPDSVVVIDEAYVDFGAESAISLVQRYPQLLVVHTLSKSRGLAGLRVGFAIGNAELIAGLNRVKDSFNSYPLDKFAQAGAVAAMQDQAYFDETRQHIIRSREQLVADLTRLGFIVLPSAANFVFARHPQYEGERLTAQLRERSIIVRHFRNPARIAPFMRITIGTDEQCHTLITALTDILQTMETLI